MCCKQLLLNKFLIQGAILGLSLSISSFFGLELASGERLIVRDTTEVLIPKSARKDVISILHLTHLATNSIMPQTKSRLFWPGIRADLESS